MDAKRCQCQMAMLVSLSVGLVTEALMGLDPAKPREGTPYIHMDAMAFGMGCCCLQITFQAWNVDEARRVYDALVPIAPIMVGLPLFAQEITS